MRRMSITHSDTVLTSDAAVLGESLGFSEEVKTFQAVMYDSATQRCQTSANIPDHAFRLIGISYKDGFYQYFHALKNVCY
jgi:hypothetical protein